MTLETDVTQDTNMSSTTGHTLSKTRRQHWMSVLSRAPLDALEQRWNSIGQQPAKRFIRPPEIGLMMVRGRAGGSGSPFNVGEVTMTRCVVALSNGLAGFGYVQGRSKRHAELAALFDAMLQDPDHQSELLNHWINPMHESWEAERKTRSKKSAATKVDFFTMVRGE